MWLRDIPNSLVCYFRSEAKETKKMFFPEKNVRRQFWMIIVAMFLAVYFKDLFDVIVKLLKIELQIWYLDTIVKILIILIVLIPILLLSYFLGLPLIHFGESLLIRNHKESENPVIEEPLKKEKSIRGQGRKKAEMEFMRIVLTSLVNLTLLGFAGGLTLIIISPEAKNIGSLELILSLFLAGGFLLAIYISKKRYIEMGEELEE